MINLIIITAIIFYALFGYWMYANGLFRRWLGKLIYGLFALNAFTHIVTFMVKRGG